MSPRPPPSKWQALLDTKPKALSEHLLDEAAVLFAKDLAQWPPRVEAFEGPGAGALADLVASTPQRPDARLFGEAFRLARFDLGRELDAYDDYVRNQRWCEAGLAAKDRPMLLFVSRLVTEQLLALNEATEGRVARRDLTRLLDRVETAFTRLAP